MGSGLVGGDGERRPRSNRDEAGHQLWGQGRDEPGAQGLWEQQELRKGSRGSGLGALGRGAGPVPALCSDPRAGRCGSHQEDTPGPSLWFAGQQRGCLGKWGPHRWSRGAGALSAGETGQPPAAYVLGGGHRGDSAWLVPATSHLSWVAFPTAAKAMKGSCAGS